MKLRYLFRFIALNIRSNFKTLALSALGVIVGIASFVFFLALGQGVQNIVTKDILGQLPSQQIEVVRKSYSLGLFKVSQMSLPGSHFDDKTLERFKKIKGVQSVYGKMNMKVPARAIVYIPKSFQKRGVPNAFVTEIVAQGLSSEVISPQEIQKGKFEWKASTENILKMGSMNQKESESKIPIIPVLISQRLLHVYNSTLANLRGLPKLSEKAVTLIPPFSLILGKSMFNTQAHEKGIRRFRCQVVGVSNKAMLIGMTVPLEFVKKVNAIYGDAKQILEYESAILVSNSPENLTSITQHIEKKGFTLSSSQIFAQKVGEIILLISLLLSLISGSILIVSSISISQAFFSFVYERRHQLGLVRALGATKATVKWMLLLEASIMGVVSGFLGIALAYSIAKVVQWGLQNFPQLPFSTSKLFLFPWWLMPSAFAISVFFCFFGALFPALQASKTEPAEILNAP